jgi:hypothetical protein
METERLTQVHIRFNGTSHDTDFADLDLTEGSSNEEVLRSVARYLDAPYSKIQNFVVDRNSETSDITVRPQAVFGYGILS